MKNWLYPKGAKYDKVKIVTQKKGYRGAIATKSIRVICIITLEKLSHRLHTQIITSLTLDGPLATNLNRSYAKTNLTSLAKTHSHVFAFAGASFFGEKVPVLSLHRNSTD
jgi:hypothetical protein